MMKHKKRLLIIFIFVFIFLTQLILWGAGWYHSPVRSSGGVLYTVSRTMEDMKAGADISNRRKADNLHDYFAYFDGLQMLYDCSFTITQGSVELVILDIENTSFVADGMEFETVQTREITASEAFSWEITDLEKGHWYALAVYGSEDSLFSGSITVNWSIRRWQYLHDKWLALLPFIEEKYYPEYEIDRFNDW